MIRIKSEFESNIKDVVIQKRMLVTPFFVKKLKSIEWELIKKRYRFGSRGNFILDVDGWFDGYRQSDDKITEQLNQANCTKSNIVPLKKCR